VGSESPDLLHRQQTAPPAPSRRVVAVTDPEPTLELGPAFGTTLSVDSETVAAEVDIDHRHLFTLYRESRELLLKQIRTEHADVGGVEWGEVVTDPEQAGVEVVVLLGHRGDAENSPISEIDETVAEANPEYPDDDPVVEVAFVDALSDAIPGWRELPPDRLFLEAASREVKTYRYPVSRLESPGGQGGRDD